MLKTTLRVLVALSLTACSGIGVTEILLGNPVPEETPQTLLPKIQVDQSHVTMTSQGINTTTTSVVKITNIGTEQLELEGLQLDDPGQAFISSQVGKPSLLPGESTHFVLSFLPNEYQDYQGSLSIQSNDPEHPSIQIGIVGDVQFPQIEITPTDSDFGTVSEAADWVLTIANVGDAPLKIDRTYYVMPASMTVVDSGGLVSNGGTCCTLEPGEKREVVVRFTPEEEGLVWGNLYIDSDDPYLPEANAFFQAYGLPCGSAGWVGDFFVQSAGGEAIHLFPADSNGGFSQPVVIGENLGERIGSHLVVGDFDGDGSMDIMAELRADEDGPSRLVQFSYDACQDDWVPTERFGTVGFSMMGAADLDNSGSLDIFGYSKNAEYGVTLMNDGTGQFTRKSNAFDLGDVQDAYWVASTYHAADINSDGYLDIAMVEYQSGGSDGATVFLFYGNGKGRFDVPQLSHVLPGPANGMDLGDFDGDGLVDLVVGLDDDGDPGQVWLLRGDGQGFGAPEDLLDVAPEVENGADDLGYGRLVLHDWNGDSLPDVTVAYYTGPWVDPVIEIFLNAPAESVLEPTLVLGVGETTNIFVATPIVH